MDYRVQRMVSASRVAFLTALCWALIWAHQPALAQNVSPDFVEATVDRTTAYVGEPILYTWRWYLAMAVVEGTEADSRVVVPTFDSFGQETLEVTTESALRDGQTYQIITQQIVLYPRREGIHTLEPLRVLIPETPFAPAKTLESLPLTLTIKPLPIDAPASFGNAIGQFNLQARLDRQEARTGDPITLTMTINGSGNVPLISAPSLIPGPEWRIYIGKSSTRQDSPLLGERTFTWTLIPLQPGTLTIPSQAWSFLNGQSGQYETRTTQPFQVTVTGEPISAPQTAPAAAEPTLYPLNYGIIPMALAHPGETPQGPIAIDYHGSRSFYPRSGITSEGLLLAAVPAGLALMIWMMSFFRKTNPQPGVKTQKQKRKNSFQQRMSSLSQKSPDQVAQGMQEVLRDYLGQRFGVVLSIDNAEEYIQRLPAAVQSDWHACFDLARTARYAPFTPEDARRLIQDAEQTLERTEALWRAR